MDFKDERLSMTARSVLYLQPPRFKRAKQVLRWEHFETLSLSSLPNREAHMCTILVALRCYLRPCELLEIRKSSFRFISDTQIDVTFLRRKTRPPTFVTVPIIDFPLLNLHFTPFIRRFLSTAPEHFTNLHTRDDIQRLFTSFASTLRWPADLTPHSPRLGAVLLSHQLGLSLNQIMADGSWKTLTALLPYTRLASWRFDQRHSRALL